MNISRMGEILRKAKRSVRWIAGSAALAAIMAWVGGACTEKVAPGVMEDGRTGVAVGADAETVAVKAEEAPALVQVVGTTASEEKIHLSARIPATISSVHVSSGTAVKRGDELVVLDDREIREQLAGAEAQFKQAETEFLRTRQLFDGKAATDQALVAAESSFNAAKAQVDRVRVMLTYARISSPIDGVVTERRIEVGDLAGPGQPLLSVYDPARMRLEADIPVRLVEKLKLGQEVDVVLERPARAFRGKVTEVVGEVDPASRTQKVKIALPEAGGQVLPGTFGRLYVEDDPVRRYMLPDSAITRVGQLEYVYVVRGGTASRRLVRSGMRMDGRTEILAGLTEGETVLAVPQEVF
ncbi:MAG: efflux RND transporter periplasmic adaptor subunit [Lentisphaerae bacterium]|nr:efflux RND transporter periplasmic adaptor subunit [Lentisphaerota bacterium]